MTNIRNLVLAFLITLIAGIAIFYIFKALFNVDDKVAQGAAAIPLTALPKVYEELEKSSARNSSTSSGKLIESLDEFGVRWQIMVFAVVLMSYVLGFVLTRTLDYFMISDEDYLRVFGAQREIGVAYIQQAVKMSVVPAILFSPILLLGYWRGRKMALSKYLKYIFDIMPGESRETLVKLAVEEARVPASQRHA
jgi:hypothetical protein